MEKMRKVFHEKFGSENAKIVKSPLRICPLGAHVDHQHGLVTGMALDASVSMMYSPNDSGYARVQSLDFPDEEYFSIDHAPEMIPGFWGNYLRGAVLSLARSFKLKRGINGVIRGRLPIGGLSSSAAVTTAYLLALADVNGLVIEKPDLIRYSHWVEKEFIGLYNGILDQSANILSRNDHLLYMDCRTEDYSLIPKNPAMPAFAVLVVYSGINKILISTDYNNRVDECKVAAWILQETGCGRVTPFKEVRLRDISEEFYMEHRGALPGRFRRRADHFYSENNRVRQGVECWKKGDLAGLGKLIFESGESSIHQYESGAPQLITIYDILKECPGVYGARFSGAGYRGCCIGIIDPAYKEAVKQRIDSRYPAKHPDFKDVYRVYFAGLDDGARILGKDESLL
ncbi:MAG: GHMP kinase [Spirochaetales bacterium]|jgi:galactokinase/galacturonokinase|nr:GHMP kinase [Spirochaetales bacterium]